jgi:hypothetical protein
VLQVEDSTGILHAVVVVEGSKGKETKVKMESMLVQMTVPAIPEIPTNLGDDVVLGIDLLDYHHLNSLDDEGNHHENDSEDEVALDHLLLTSSSGVSSFRDSPMLAVKTPITAIQSIIWGRLKTVLRMRRENQKIKTTTMQLAMLKTDPAI